MRNDLFPGNYLGEKWGTTPDLAWHISFLGADQGYGTTGSVSLVGSWPWGNSDNRNPW